MAYVSVRPPMTRGVRGLLIANVAIFLILLVVSAANGFNPATTNWVTRVLGLSAEGVGAGYLFEPLTYMWLHSMESIWHIVFNMAMLYMMGPTLEARWGTRKLLIRYLLMGLGGAALILLTGFLWPILFDSRQPPTIGASGAVSGLIAAYCIYYWHQTLRVFFFDMTGRGLLILFLALDIIRLAMREPIAVQGHWGGMITAFLIIRPNFSDPKLLLLKFKRWRLRRRLRLEKGGKEKRTEDYLH